MVPDSVTPHLARFYRATLTPQFGVQKDRALLGFFNYNDYEI